VRDGNQQQTLRAFPWDYHLAVLAAFEHGFKAVQTQIAFRLLLAMASKTRNLKERLDVLHISYAFLVRCRRQFAQIGVSRQKPPDGSKQNHQLGQSDHIM
jgi:hypothetical protein